MCSASSQNASEFVSVNRSQKKKTLHFSLSRFALFLSLKVQKDTTHWNLCPSLSKTAFFLLSYPSDKKTIAFSRETLSVSSCECLVLGKVERHPWLLSETVSFSYSLLSTVHCSVVDSHFSFAFVFGLNYKSLNLGLSIPPSCLFMVSSVNLEGETRAIISKFGKIKDFFRQEKWDTARFGSSSVKENRTVLLLINDNY